MAIYASVLPNVIVMEYTYETNTLNDIADLVKSVLKKVFRSSDPNNFRDNYVK